MIAATRTRVEYAIVPSHGLNGVYIFEIAHMYGCPPDMARQGSLEGFLGWQDSPPPPLMSRVLLC